MKQLNLSYRGTDWHIIMSVDSLGLCDTTIYRTRKTKKWWQSKHEYFDDIITCPDSIEQQISIIKKVIDNKLEEDSKRKNFLCGYSKLEDVSFL